MIQRMGRYLTVDAEGYLVPDMSKDLIPPHWMAMINDIIAFVEQQKNDNILSIYLRGTLPPVDGLSDLDLVFVVRNSSVKLSKKEFEAQLIARYPFCTDIEWMVSLEERFKEPKPGQDYPYVAGLLKTQSVHLWGHDYVAHLPKVKPGRAMMTHTPNFEWEWAEFLTVLPQLETQDQIDKECRWIGKRILRTAFEIVSLKRLIFTRDLYLCYETVAAEYPYMKTALYDVLELTLGTGASREEILNVFTPVAEFLLPLCREFS